MADLATRYKEQQAGRGVKAVDYKATTRAQAPTAPRTAAPQTDYIKKAELRPDTRSNVTKLGQTSRGVFSWIGRTTADTFSNAGEAIGGFTAKRADLDAINQRGVEANTEIEVAHGAYKAGRITKDEYSTVLSQAGETYKRNNSEARAIDEDLVLRKYLVDTISVVTLPLAFGKLTALSTRS